jgi:hypothetical protein
MTFLFSLPSSDLCRLRGHSVGLERSKCLLAGTRKRTSEPSAPSVSVRFTARNAIPDALARERTLAGLRSQCPARRFEPFERPLRLSGSDSPPLQGPSRLRRKAFRFPAAAGFLIVAVVAVLAAGAPAAHASAGDAQICAQASGDHAIAACTRVIGSGAYQGRHLAVRSALVDARFFIRRSGRGSRRGSSP